MNFFPQELLRIAIMCVLLSLAKILWGRKDISTLWITAIGILYYFAIVFTQNYWR